MRNVSPVEPSFRSNDSAVSMRRQPCSPPAEGAVADETKGIMLVLEAGEKKFGVVADKLLGVQEIVVKPVPKYIKKMMKTTGVSGCTLLGDGSISLILDPQLLNKMIYA